MLKTFQCALLPIGFCILLRVLTVNNDEFELVIDLFGLYLSLLLFKTTPRLGSLEDSAVVQVYSTFLNTKKSSA